MGQKIYPTGFRLGITAAAALRCLRIAREGCGRVSAGDVGTRARAEHEDKDHSERHGDPFAGFLTVFASAGSVGGGPSCRPCRPVGGIVSIIVKTAAAIPCASTAAISCAIEAAGSRHACGSPCSSRPEAVCGRGSPGRSEAVCGRGSPGRSEAVCGSLCPRRSEAVRGRARRRVLRRRMVIPVCKCVFVFKSFV